MVMTIQDAATVQQLRTVQAVTVLTDGAGVIIGQFIPGNPCGNEPKLSEEEWRRLEQQPGRPLAEILADLEKRT